MNSPSAWDDKADSISVCDGIRLYSQPNFQGISTSLSLGEFKTCDYVVSSIRIPPCYRVTLYEKENFNNTSPFRNVTLTSDSAEVYAQIPWKDKLLSARVLSLKVYFPCYYHLFLYRGGEPPKYMPVHYDDGNGTWCFDKNVALYPVLTVTGQKRIAFEIPGYKSNDYYKVDDNLNIFFSLKLYAEGKRSSICLLETLADLNICTGTYACAFCYDLAGTFMNSKEIPSTTLQVMSRYQIPALQKSSHNPLRGRQIRYISFINEPGTNTSVTYGFEVQLLEVLKYEPLTITSNDYKSLSIKIKNATAADSIYFNLVEFNHLLSSTNTETIIPVSPVYPKDVLVTGFLMDYLSSGHRYSFLFKPSDNFGNLTVPADPAKYLFGTAVVSCSCTSSLNGDMTGAPLNFIARQEKGLVSFSFIDNSVCESAYTVTRRPVKNITNVITISNSYNSKNSDECNNMFVLDTDTFGDRLLQVDSKDRNNAQIVGETYGYCVAATNMDKSYMKDLESIYNPDRSTSNSTCQDVRIAWESNIVISASTSIVQIPTPNVTIKWAVLNPDNFLSVAKNCSIGRSCASNTQTDNSGSSKIAFFIDEPILGLTNTIPVPFRFTFDDCGDSHKFIVNNQDVTVSGTVVYLTHLDFSKTLSVTVASTKLFTGKVVVDKTSWSGSSGCPIFNATVCAYMNQIVAGGADVSIKLDCSTTDTMGDYKLAIPLGATVHDVKVSYFSHTFVKASTNLYDYSKGILIENNCGKVYSNNDFVDTHKTPVSVTLAGGLCDRRLGSGKILAKIHGCNWDGMLVDHESVNKLHNFPAHDVTLQVTNIRNDEGTVLNGPKEYFLKDENIKHLDLRKYSDVSADIKAQVPNSASNMKQPSDSQLTRSDSDSVPKAARFQYDGTLKMSIMFDKHDEITETCSSHVLDYPDMGIDSLHLMKADLLNVALSVAVFYEIYPTGYTGNTTSPALTCDIVDDDIQVILESWLAMENHPGFTDAEYYTKKDKSIFDCSIDPCVDKIDHSSRDNTGKALGGAGKTYTSLSTGRPEVIHPFVKLLTITLNPGNGRTSITHTAGVIIYGPRQIGEGLAYAIPTHNPLMILRE